MDTQLYLQESCSNKTIIQYSRIK